MIENGYKSNAAFVMCGYSTNAMGMTAITMIMSLLSFHFFFLTFSKI